MEITIPMFTDKSPLRTVCPYCNGKIGLLEHSTERVQFTVGCTNTGCDVQPRTMPFYDVNHAIFVWDCWQKESFCQPLPPVGVVIDE